MAIYNQVLLYTFRDSLASGDPQKVIFGSYLDGEFGAIHTASLDAVSLSGNNTIVGNNSFTGTNTFSGAGITTTFAGKLAVGAPSSGIPISIAANDNSTAILVNDPSAASGIAALTVENSGVVRGQIGTGAAVQTGAALGDFCLVANTGTFRIGNGSATLLSVTNAGNVTIAAPTSGVALSLPLVSGGSVNNPGLQLANNSIFTFLDSAASTVNAGFIWYDNTNKFTIGTGNSSRVSVSATGNVTIVAPSSSHTLSLTAAAGSEGLVILTPTTAGNSFGLIIEGGTNSSDYGLRVTNATASLNYFQVRGDGAILGGGPVAATLVDMTPDTGTFTGTFTGFTAGITGTCTWTRIGKLVLLAFPQTVQGTSNATTFTMTGVPAAIQPATLNQTISLPGGSLTDNSTNALVCGVQITAGSGTFTFERGSGGLVNLWTNSGIKGFSGGVNYTQMTIAYLLN